MVANVSVAFLVTTLTTLSALEVNVSQRVVSHVHMSVDLCIMAYWKLTGIRILSAVLCAS